MLPRQTEWKSMTFGMAWSVLENFMFFVMNKHEQSSLKRVFLEFLEFQVRLRFLFEPGRMSLKVNETADHWYDQVTLF